MRKFGALRERIKNVYGRQREFAVAMDMNLATLNFKLNGKSEFTRIEMERMCHLLDIPMVEIPHYFFY